MVLLQSFLFHDNRKGSGSFRRTPPRNRVDAFDGSNFSSPDLQDDEEDSIKFIDVPGDSSSSAGSRRDQGKTGTICPKTIVRKL